MLTQDECEVLGIPAVPRFGRRPSAVSQLLRAIRDDLERGPEAWDLKDPTAEGSGAELRMRVASDLQTRKRAYALAHRVYRGCGYVPSGADRLIVSPYDARPDTLTLLVEDAAGREAATVTLVFDSPAALPSDELYGAELAVLRKQGRRMAEVTRLAIDETHAQSKQLLVRLFNFLYIYARRVRGFDDFVIEVNPRHVAYYRRLLLFDVVGPERPCPRVQGAPAVLLRVDLEVGDREVRRVGGQGTVAGERTLYPYFYSWMEEGAVAEFLRHRCRPMSEEEKRCFGIG